MRTAHGVRMAVAGLPLAAMPVIARHSFKAEYDSNQMKLPDDSQAYRHRRQLEEP